MKNNYQSLIIKEYLAISKQLERVRNHWNALCLHMRSINSVIESRDKIEGEDDVKDVIREMCNMVGGNLKSAFCDAGLICEFSPPSFTTGNDFKYRGGLTLDDAMSFSSTLPFKEFGYMVKKVAKKKVAKKVAVKPAGRPVGTKLKSFVFVGNGLDDPESIVMSGYAFKLNGKATKVSAEAAEKLSTNSHFREK